MKLLKPLWKSYSAGELFKILLFLIIYFCAQSYSCFAQDASRQMVSENDFEKITFFENISIEDLKVHNQSWILLREKLGPPEKEEDKDEFVEQTKTVYYNGAKFFYSNAGASSGNFTLANISILEPGFYVTIQNKRLQVGDDIEKATIFNHSKNNSTLSIKIYLTDAVGNFRYHESGEPMTAEMEFFYP